MAACHASAPGSVIPKVRVSLELLSEAASSSVKSVNFFFFTVICTRLFYFLLVKLLQLIGLLDYHGKETALRTGSVPIKEPQWFLPLAEH